jgi:hypothetical protein
MTLTPAICDDGNLMQKNKEKEGQLQLLKSSFRWKRDDTTTGCYQSGHAMIGQLEY